MPAVATALHREFGTAPSVVDQPELVVAEGSLRVPGHDAMSGAAAPAPQPGELGTARPVPAGTTSGTRIAAWWSRWGRLASTVGAAAGVLGLIVTTVVVVTTQGGDDGGSLADSPGGTPSVAVVAGTETSPTPTPTPTSVNGVDSCMLGTWRSIKQQSINIIDGREVQFTGLSGVIQTYTPDGTVTLDFAKSTDAYATVNGVRWRSRVRGTATAKVRHRDGMEYISDVRAKGTMDLYRGKVRNSREPLQVLLEPAEYLCDGDTMRFFGNGVTEYERVR